ncbi:hypothetical protein SUGI_0504230 [Cryptomeria japonica]|nr:hypothetical protein SUGI_0504230 [Cryptomeria japonica]
MTVKVLFFVRACDLAGVSDKVLDMEEGSNTLDCVNKIILQVASLKAIYDYMMVALNEMYTSDSTIVTTSKFYNLIVSLGLHNKD